MTAKKILIIVENLPVPFDRRVWQEATTLKANGYEVSIICPTGKNYTARHEVLDGINIYRHPLPLEANGALGYALEYGSALFWELLLAVRVYRRHGFDAIHACNPPDTIFLVAGIFKYLFGKKFLFDHHDINPELYEAKFGRRDFFYKLICWLERMTFKVADVSIATNESYKRIAIERGGKDPADVFVVRSGPSLERLKLLPPDESLKKGKKYLVGYVGVMGKQEGIEYLLKAAAHLKKQGRNDIHYGLIGGGPELELLKQQAAQYGLDDSDVTFTGRVPDAALLAMLNTADVCVNPDEANAMNDKSTMNKIMEYMALGKPIVQFDLTEGRFSAGEASLYAAANDAEDMAAKIVWLLDNPDACAKMGAYGRARVENDLEWRHEVPKLLAAYGRLFA
ncbi:MAG: glycosyltransferase family 4 protein [Alphaproteobacteria bacterium]|nr:glycosyltransferase family 4 protein [Alphaproteobacteria bacterium]